MNDDICPSCGNNWIIEQLTNCSKCGFSKQGFSLGYFIDKNGNRDRKTEKTFTTSMNRKVCYDEGFQKGKLEQKKEELEFLDKLNRNTSFDQMNDNFDPKYEVPNRIEQLSKEIINSQIEEKEVLL